MISSSIGFRATRGRRAARTRTAGACTAAAGALTLLLAASPAEAQYTLASVATDGTPGNGSSTGAVISGNGRYVAFTSTASNLVANDTNGVADVFVRDLVGNVTTRVSVTSAGVEGAGPSRAARISDDGRIVVFTSEAALVADDVNQSCSEDACVDVYAHDRTTGVTTRVSVATGGTQANSGSVDPDLSADGRYVVFRSAASNLTPGDTNGAPDVFLRDLTTLTTTRVSEWQDGQGLGVTDGVAPAISADGLYIAFVALDTAFAGTGPAEASCPATGCRRAHVKGRASGELVRLPAIGEHVDEVVLNGDGRRAAMHSRIFAPAPIDTSDILETVDVSTGRLQRITSMMNRPLANAAISRDGRTAGIATGAGSYVLLVDVPTLHTQPNIQWMTGDTTVAFDASGRYAAFFTAAAVFPADTNANNDVYVYDRDQDGDGMLTFWETQYGFDPDSAADAALDPDGDGVSNLQEYLARSHPQAPYKRYFAEGASNSFFATRFDLLVPGDTAANVMVRLLGADRQIQSRLLDIGAKRQRAFLPGSDTPHAVYSAVIESTQPIVADRLMTWDGRGYGSHLESGVEAPASEWYLAEGATGGPFSLFYLLQNPGDTDASVSVDYLRPSPAPVISKTYPVPAYSRFTVDVAGEDPGLSGGDVSAKVTASSPIVVERAMYRTRPGQPFAAGHAGAGITTPATRWFLAEGATGFFDEYVLIANAEANLAKITLTFLLPDAAATFTDTIDVEANSRYTVDLKSYPALAATPVSVIVESTNTVPVVVERAMWWPSGIDPYEASLSAGVTTTGTKWAVAGGQQGEGYQTYVLVANTDPTRDGQARITLHFGSADPIETTIDVPRNGRATLDVGTLLDASQNRAFGIVVEGLDSLPIVVERSLYDNAEGVPFAAGGTSVATNITPQF